MLHHWLKLVVIRDYESAFDALTLLHIYRFVDTSRDAASFCRLSSFIEYLNYVHYSKLAFAIACSFIVNKLRATNSSISPDE